MRVRLFFFCLIFSLAATLSAQTDTISPSDFNLDEVTVVERRASVVKSRISPLNTERVTGQELCKAACCNLSESFETSASVDVAYADAATGAKQIRLLGLGGTYVQLLTENTPGIRGLAQSFGMEYIPGPWMESIQVSKGTSSVINGYESMTGQINVEYRKPQTGDSLTANAMINKDLQADINLTGGWNINPDVSTGLLVHAGGGFLPMDDNKDGFTDMPRNYNLNLLNRWYITRGDYTGQVLVRTVYDRRLAGQTLAAQKLSPSPYIIDLSNRRIDGFVKNGYVFDHTTGMSIGIIAAGSYHSLNNDYGPQKHWDAAQGNAYLNAIFQTNFENDRLDPADLHEHKLSAGVSLNYDHFKEILDLPQGLLDYSRQEATPGLFAEYTYSYIDKVTVLAGIREDYSTRYGFFTTPRFNIRYAPFEWWTMRGSIGLGYRSPNVIADNASLFANNRKKLFPYNPNQEKAMNAGVTTTFYIPIGKRELQISGEYYYTRFLDAVLTDIDADPKEVRFYNLKDNGLQYFAHVAQLEASVEVLRGWTWTLAFRYTDTRQSSLNTKTGQFELREKALTNRFKGIITTSYQTPLRKWQFDITAQFNGFGRMPDSFVIPSGSTQYYTNSRGIYHKWYPQLMAQVTKNFRHWSLYVGAENMTNFTQDEPVYGTHFEGTTFVDPYNPAYDASNVWAPIHGWKLYAGFRWSLERDD